MVEPQTGTRAKVAFQSGEQMDVLYKVYQTFVMVTEPLLDTIGPFLADDAGATLNDFWDSVCSFKQGPLAPWAPTAPKSWITRSLSTALQQQVREYFRCFRHALIIEEYHYSISTFSVFLSPHAN